MRLRGVEDRPAAEALRGQALAVEQREAPALAEGEWWAHELEGCEVVDGERLLGTVSRLIELPSCEALEVTGAARRRAAARADGQRRDPPRRPLGGAHRGQPDFLALPARAAPRRGSPRRRGVVVRIDIFTLFPEWFEWFASQRHVSNALAGGIAVSSA